MPSYLDSPNYRVEYAKFSDVGMRRANNQDSIAVVAPPNGGEAGLFLMVADGMGAHAAGELASKIATDCVPHAFHKRRDMAPQVALRQSVQKANAEIYAKGQSAIDMQGMGTTCSCLALLDDAALVAQVGDSRVYRLRAGQLEQLTFDHSLVWEMAQHSKTTEDKIPSCIPKNVITRSLGPHPTVNVDLEGPFSIEPSDIFLLCSDGLTGVVDDVLIGAICGVMAPEEAGQTLVDLANLRGGPDNISVLIARIEGGEKLGERVAGEASGASVRLRKRDRFRPVAWAAFMICVAALAWFSVQRQPQGAVLAAAGAGAALTLAVAGRRDAVEGGETHQCLGGPYGNGPHRKFDCRDNAATAATLGGVVEELAELRNRPVEEGGLTIDEWGDFLHLQQAGFEADARNDHRQAVVHYAEAIRVLMVEVRADRRAASA